MDKFQIIECLMTYYLKRKHPRTVDVFKVEDKHTNQAVRWCYTREHAEKVKACAEKEGFRGRC